MDITSSRPASRLTALLASAAIAPALLLGAPAASAAPTAPTTATVLLEQTAPPQASPDGFCKVIPFLCR